MCVIDAISKQERLLWQTNLGIAKSYPENHGSDKNNRLPFETAYKPTKNLFSYPGNPEILKITVQTIILEIL